ncbi:MAG: hypothetical protein JOY78_09535, partial [Pseudonocardia sp.]|nr:hypothetical protein [Pseudonocardia sp.]
MSRVRPAARTLLACAVTAGLVVAGCGSFPNTNKAPDIQSLPSPAPSAPLPSPSAAPVTPRPTPTAEPKPAGAQPGRGTARAGAALGAGPGFTLIGGDDFNAPSV